MSRTRTILAMSATTAVAAGALLGGAGAANAANDPDFQKLKAPGVVTAGTMFRIACQLDKSVNWRGAEASLVMSLSFSTSARLKVLGAGAFAWASTGLPLASRMGSLTSFCPECSFRTTQRPSASCLIP